MSLNLLMFGALVARLIAFEVALMFMFSWLEI